MASITSKLVAQTTSPRIEILGFIKWSCIVIIKEHIKLSLILCPKKIKHRNWIFWPSLY